MRATCAVGTRHRAMDAGENAQTVRDIAITRMRKRVGMT